MREGENIKQSSYFKTCYREKYDKRPPWVLGDDDPELIPPDVIEDGRLNAFILPLFVTVMCIYIYLYTQNIYNISLYIFSLYISSHI